MRFFNLYKASQGQSLAEYALIAGIVSIGCITGLSLFSGSLADALSTFQKSVIPNTTSSATDVVGTAGGNGTPSKGNTTPGATVSGTSSVLTPAELSQLQAQNQQIQQFYSSLLNGTANPVEVAGSLGESANQIYAMAQKLTQLAAEVQATDPAKALQILELAKSGKILAGFQMSIVGETEYSNGIINHEDDKFLSKIAQETNTPINGFQPDGTFNDSANLEGMPGVWNINDSVKATQTVTLTFNQQYMALQSTLAQYNLSSSAQNTLDSASLEILAKSGTYTFENALNTYDKSKTIETVQTAP